MQRTDPKSRAAHDIAAAVRHVREPSGIRIPFRGQTGKLPSARTLRKSSFRDCRHRHHGIHGRPAVAQGAEGGYPRCDSDRGPEDIYRRNRHPAGRGHIEPVRHDRAPPDPPDAFAGMTGGGEAACPARSRLREAAPRAASRPGNALCKRVPASRAGVRPPPPPAKPPSHPRKTKLSNRTSRAFVPCGCG